MQHNGWTNYETWNAHLWLTNDEYIYLSAKLRTSYVGLDNRVNGLRDLIKDMGNPDSIDLAKVNWSEVILAIRGTL